MIFICKNTTFVKTRLFLRHRVTNISFFSLDKSGFFQQTIENENYVKNGLLDHIKAFEKHVWTQNMRQLSFVEN